MTCAFFATTGLNKILYYDAWAYLRIKGARQSRTVLTCPQKMSRPQGCGSLYYILSVIYNYPICLFGNILNISCGELNIKQLYFWLYYRDGKNSWHFINIVTVSSYDNYTFRSATGYIILLPLQWQTYVQSVDYLGVSETKHRSKAHAREIKSDQNFGLF